jgi:hypothetical protein
MQPVARAAARAKPGQCRGGDFLGRMIMAATHEITISESQLRGSLLEYYRRLDEEQHWAAVRIGSDGKSYVSIEASRCISEDEWNHRMPHTVTVLSAHGAGQCDLEEGWEDSDDTVETMSEDIQHCVKELENAGYEVILA